METFRFPKVHSAKISKEWLETLVSAQPAGISSTQRGRDPSRLVNVIASRCVPIEAF